MKKLLSIIISSVVVVALAIGLIVLTININNEKEYSLTVGASVGGNVQLVVDDDLYDINANRSKTYKVKKKSKIKILAMPSIGYEFSNWEIDGEDEGANPQIEISVKKETDVYANFILSNVDLTIVDGEFNETFEYSPASNLLSTLQNRYVAETGYNYVYSIGDKTVDENTTISKATTITRQKVEIKYAVVFKNDEKQIGDTQYYTISTKDAVKIPSIPTFENIEHYTDIAWEELDLTTLGDKVVNLNKTAIEYTIEFKHKDTVVSTEKYTIESVDIQEPKIEDISNQEYYTYSWADYTLTYSSDTLVVTTVETPVVNTITYKNSNNEVVATINYSKDEFIEKSETIFIVPEITESIAHYTLSWSEDLNNILSGAFETYCGKHEAVNTEITTTKTAVEYAVTFKVNGEVVESEDNIFTADDYTIKAPALNNNQNGVYYEFELPTLTKEDLGRTDIVISAVQYVKISFKRTLQESVTVDNNKFVFAKLVDGSFELINGNVVLYNIPSSTKKAEVVNNATLFAELATYTTSAGKTYTPQTINGYFCNAKTFAAVMNEVIKLYSSAVTIDIDFKI